MILEDILTSSPYLFKPDNATVEEWHTILTVAIEKSFSEDAISALQIVKNFLADIVPKLRAHFIDKSTHSDPYTSYKYFVILYNVYAIRQKYTLALVDFSQVDLLELIHWLEQQHDQITSKSQTCTIRFLTAWRDTLPS